MKVATRLTLEDQIALLHQRVRNLERLEVPGNLSDGVVFSADGAFTTDSDYTYDSAEGEVNSTFFKGIFRPTNITTQYNIAFKGTTALTDDDDFQYNNATKTLTVDTIETESWNTVSSFSNSWANYGGSYPDARYRKGADGLVNIQGFLKSGTGNGSIVYTLPGGYRPDEYLVFPLVHMTSGSAITCLYFMVRPDGTVRAYCADNPLWASFDATFYV